jgi:hypothetical protein
MPNKTPQHEDLWESIGIASSIARWRWVVSCNSGQPWPLYLHEKSPLYVLARRLGGSQSRAWRNGEQRNIYPSRESNLGHPSYRLDIVGSLPLLLCIIYDTVCTFICCVLKRCVSGADDGYRTAKNGSDSSKMIIKFSGVRFSVTRDESILYKWTLS